MNYLDFEAPIFELEGKIEALRSVNKRGGDDETMNVDLRQEIKGLKRKSNELTKKIFSNLGAWQIAQIARHPDRPYTQDYIDYLYRFR